MPGQDVLEEPKITDTSPTDSKNSGDAKLADSTTATKDSSPQAGATITPTDSSTMQSKGSKLKNAYNAAKYIHQNGGVKGVAKAAAKAAAEKAVRYAGDAIAPGVGEAAVIAMKSLQEAIRKRSIVAGLRELRRQLTLKKGAKTAKNLLIVIIIILIVSLLLLCIVVTIIVMLLSCILGSCGGDAYGGVLQKQSTLSLSMDAAPSDKANAGDKIIYTIRVKSTAPTTSIVITDPVPTNTRFYPEDNTSNNIINQCAGTTPTNPGQDTSGKGFYCDLGLNKSVTWNLTGSPNASADTPFETSLTVTFTVIANNVKIFNVASAESQEASASATTNTDNPYNTDLQVGP